MWSNWWQCLLARDHDRLHRGLLSCLIQAHGCPLVPAAGWSRWKLVGSPARGGNRARRRPSPTPLANPEFPHRAAPKPSPPGPFEPPVGGRRRPYGWVNWSGGLGPARAAVRGRLHGGLDHLILAAGAETNFFGVTGMHEHGWPLHTLTDAARLRRHLLSTLERVARNAGPDARRVRIVVVGGGPTGVETAGALSSKPTRSSDP